MKKPIKTYFDTICRNLVITDKKLDRPRYRYIASYTTVPNAEAGAERMTEQDGEIARPSLDKDLADFSGYSLSWEDIDIYCVEL